MAWDGSGNFSRTNGVNTGDETWQDDAATSVKIRADRHDTHDQDLATGISECLTKNGESKPTNHFLPNINATYTIGSATYKWKDIHLSGDITAGGDITVGGSLTLGGVNKFTKGADIASATNLTLGTDGDYFDVTGTTTIATISTVSIGSVVKLHFDSSLTLTHSTDLVLPGSRDFNIRAGDEIEFIEYATGDWRCTNYVPAKVSTCFSCALETSTSMTASAKTVNDTNFTGLTVSTDGNASGFDASTGRFTPTVAGWYIIGYFVTGENIATGYYMSAKIEKNGVSYFNNLSTKDSGDNYRRINASIPVYMNGSTDYITYEISGSYSSWNVLGSVLFNTTRFYGFLTSDY